MHQVERTGPSNVLFWSVATAATLGSIVLLYAPFLLGEKMFSHDSLSHATVMGLFYDRLFSGDSLLWSSALNGGHPIWVSLEIVPTFDPVVVIVYSLATVLRSDWLTPYYITCFIWIFLFSLGGAFCTHRLTQNRWASLLTYVILFAGPFVLAVPAASNGFLVPFRYLPLLIYFYFRMRRSVTITNIFSFSSVLAFSLAGYQSVYPFLMYLSLVVIELLLGGRSYLAWLWRLAAPRNLWPWLIPILALLPTLSWLNYTSWLIPTPWHYGIWTAFFFKFQSFFEGMFLTYYELMDSGVSSWFWHGSSFIGLLVLPLLAIALRTNFSHVTGVSWRSPVSGTGGDEAFLPLLLNLWILSSIVLATGALGIRELIEQEKGLLGIRNTGFILSGVIFLIAILAGQGLDLLSKETRFLTGLALDTAIFAFVAWISSYWIVAYTNPNLTALFVVVGLFFFVALTWRLLARNLDSNIFAASVVALITIEIVTFSVLVIPSNSVAIISSFESQERRVGDRQAYPMNINSWPRFWTNREQLPNQRLYEFPAYEHWPFFLEGPAVFRISSAMTPAAIATAMTPAAIATPTDFLFAYTTHLFRLRPYDEALNGSLDRMRLAQILGVTRPILEIVQHQALEQGPEGLRFVTRLMQEGDDKTVAISLGDAHRKEDLSSTVGEVLSVDYAGSRVSINLRADESAVLVYRDNIAPGWSVTVDGKQAELLVVDQLNKAVAVATGEHFVEFRYRPWAYLISFALRTISLAVAGLGCLTIIFRSNRGGSA